MMLFDRMLFLWGALLVLVVSAVWAAFNKDPRKLAWSVAFVFCIVIILVHQAILDKRTFLEMYTDADAATDGVDPHVAAIAKGLTIYCNAIVPALYSGGKVWRNIMPPPKTCEDPSVMNFTFDAIPSFSRTNGAYLGNNRLVGPPSHLLGINGDTSFTIFVTMRFTSFPAAASETLADKEHTIFQIYANTDVRNNGIRLYYKRPLVAAGPVHNVPFTLHIGNTNLMNLHTTSTSSTQDETAASAIKFLSISTQQIYTFVIRKSFRTIKTVLYTNQSDLQSTENRQVVLDESLADENSTIRFSNREMVFNDTREQDAFSLYAFGMYNYALSDAEMGTLYQHIHDDLRTLDPSYMSYQENLQELQEQIDAMKRCPYPETSGVCTSCASIADWSAPNHMQYASSNCLAAIHRYCSANPSSSNCECWASNSLVYNSAGCVNLRAMYAQQATAPPPPPPPAAPNCDPSKLSQSELNEISRLNNLCKCDAVMPPPTITKSASGAGVENPWETGNTTFTDLNLPATRYAAVIKDPKVQTRPSFFSWIFGK